MSIEGKSWYDFKAAADGQSAELFIYSDIGAFGVNASDFAKDLRALGKVKRIDLRINSQGGSVFDGTAIYNMLKRNPATIHVHVDGVAASMASLIAMAGDKVIMPRNALMMIHDPAGGVLGTARDMKDMAEVLDKLRDGMVEAYASKTGMSHDEIKGLMADETWMDAEEALEMGFADSVEEPVAIAASVDLSKFKHPPVARVNANKEVPVAKVDNETAEQMEARLRTELTASITETVKQGIKDEEARAAAEAAAAAGKETPEQIVARVTADVAAKAKAANSQIVALCDLAGRKDLALDYIASGKTVEEVTADLAAKRGEKKPGAEGKKPGADDEISAHNNGGRDERQIEAKGLEVGGVYARWNGKKNKRAA